MGVNIMLRIMESISEQVLVREPKIAFADAVSCALEQLALEARKALIVPGVDGRKEGAISGRQSHG